MLGDCLGKLTQKDSQRRLRQVRDKNFAISPIGTNVYFERSIGQSVKKGRDGGGGQFPRD